MELAPGPDRRRERHLLLGGRLQLERADDQPHRHGVQRDQPEFTAIEGNTGDPNGVWDVPRRNDQNYVLGFALAPYGPGGGYQPAPPPAPGAHQPPATLPVRGFRVLALSTPPMVGTDVWSVQDRLAGRGWQVGVDGEFGLWTDGIVRRFQADKGLVSDGVVGPVTWGAIFRTDNVT